jgi:hypothetical protein
LLFAMTFPKKGLLRKVIALVHHGALVPLP